MTVEQRRRPVRVRTVVGALSIVLLCILAAVFLRYFLPIARAVRADSQRQKRLLLETDYGALLEACRELMERVEEGDLQPGQYFIRREPNAEVASFPGIIRNLEPTSVFLWKGEPVRVELGGGFHCFGVWALPAGSSPDSRGDAMHLVPGLSYYDTEYDEYPALRPRIEKLIREGIARTAEKRR